MLDVFFEVSPDWWQCLSRVGCCCALPHGLSQQGVWVPFWTPKPLKSTPQDTHFILRGISKNLNLKLIIECFHLLTIPMILFNDIMPYSDEFIHVYGWNMNILWSPLKIWMPKNLTTANFRHPVSKSWLRHCFTDTWYNAIYSSLSYLNWFYQIDTLNQKIF